MSAPGPGGPDLTVLLAALSDAAVLETTLLHLRAQTARDRIELLVVAPDLSRLGPLPVDMDALYDCRVVEVPSATTGARANAAGIRAASAPVVVLTEDHAFADRHWGSALIEAHEGPWAAVGPAFVNANPATRASWADFLLSYGPWIEPTPPGPRPFLPGHNSSYKREVLLALGDELEAMLDKETVLHYRLAAQGHRLYLEPAARVAHLNFSRWTAVLRANFVSGRVYAAAVRAGWSPWKKAVYALAAPLIPFVRLLRCLRLTRDPGRRRLVPAAFLPALVLALLADGAGQITGHLSGAGNATAQMARMEYRRVDHVTTADRRAVEALTERLRSGDA